MPALDALELFAHDPTLRLAGNAVVLEALHSPALLPDVECSMARLMIQYTAMLEVLLCCAGS